MASVTLFFLGAATAYLAFTHTLRWLIGVEQPLHELLNPNDYLSLILLLMFAFGVTFEFPVVLVALELVGVVTPAKLLRSWRWAVIGITIGSAVLTPSSDPFSMLALLVPLIAFYFLAIGIGEVLGSRTTSQRRRPLKTSGPRTSVPAPRWQPDHPRHDLGHRRNDLDQPHHLAGRAGSPPRGVRRPAPLWS